MRRSLVLLLAPIIVAILSFLPSTVGTVMQKPDTQILNLTPSSPVYARSPISAKKLAFVPASTSPQNAAILSPVPPPSPTSPTTFKNGVVIPVTGTAGGIGFQNFVVETFDDIRFLEVLRYLSLANCKISDVSFSLWLCNPTTDRVRCASPN